MKCETCGVTDVRVEYDDEDTLSFYCGVCGKLLERYYKVKPVVEHKVDGGIVVTFSYEAWKNETAVQE